MRSSRVITAVDTHTEGMPTRIVTGGVATLPGDSMSARRSYAIEHLQGLRGFLMDEPRGHAAMSGAILQPPTTADADFGVIYIEAGGIHPMCGHGTMGVATVLVETEMVPVTEPLTRVRLDTPAGMVVAEVTVQDGKATQVRLENVPAFVLALDQRVTIPGIGELIYDMAYGGNFYPILPLSSVGLNIDRSPKDKILQAGIAVITAVNEQNPPTHPLDTSIHEVLHVQFTAPGRDGSDSRNALGNLTGYFDRSPCGTGTCARMAQLHHRGELQLGARFVNESIIGSRFTGELVGTTMVGDFSAVIPTVTGRAWITGLSQYLLDPTDPFPNGFKV